MKLQGITVKLMMVISLLVMVSMSSTGGFIYLRLQKQFKDEQITSMKELSEITENYIDQYLFTINNLLVVASESGYLTNPNKEDLERFFERQLLLSGDFISSMFFIDQGGKVYGYPHLVLDFMPQTVKDKLYPYSSLTTFGQTEPFNFPGLGKTLTLYKKVWNPKQFEFIGILAVNIHPDAILKQITGFDSQHHRSIVLFSHTNQLIGQTLFDPAESETTGEQSMFLRHLTERIGEYERSPVLTQTLNNVPYYSSLSSRNTFGWKVMVLVGEEELYKEFRKLKMFFIAFSVFAVLASLIAGYLFSVYLSRPLLTIVNQMKHVVRGDLAGRIRIERKDEIGFLIRHFNLMLDRITELIKELVIKENSKMKAELNMYQAQINPHFLYNTLNSIQWMARMNLMKEVDGAIVRLVPLLQYSLKKEFVVTLKQEMEQLERYGELQQIRYKGQIRVGMNVAEEIDWNEPCLKMIIQPLVENAIRHGLDPNPEGGRVIVRIEMTKDEERLKIRIIDNGAGMNRERLDWIRRLQYSPEGGESHSGLFNVIRRLSFYPSAEGAIRFWSKLRFGTIVEISWNRGLQQDESRYY